MRVTRQEPAVLGNGQLEMFSGSKRCFGCVAVLGMLLLGGCGKDDAASEAFLEEKIACPSPAVDEFAPWSQSGSEHVCKIKHGPFIAFESGRVQIRGQYDQGKESGVWRWYGADGKVVKEIDYSKTP